MLNPGLSPLKISVYEACLMQSPKLVFEEIKQQLAAFKFVCPEVQWIESLHNQHIGIYRLIDIQTDEFHH